MGTEAIAGIVIGSVLAVVAVLTLVLSVIRNQPEVTAPSSSATRVTADRGGVGIVGETSENIIITGPGTTVVRGGDYESAAPTATALHQLPPPPGDFTGRQAELDELMAEMRKGGATISGLRGMGGVGKTALALKLAEQLTERYPDAQLYLDLKGTTSDPLTAADAMAHVIRGFQPTAQLPESEAELRGLYLSALHDKRALLLMDNAANREQVEPLIPPSGCVLLVTWRQRFTLQGLYARDLDTLPPGDARDLLLAITPRIKQQADSIAKLCGYLPLPLPLALRLAAGVLDERMDLNPQDYVNRLADAQKRLELVNASLSLSYDLLSPEMQGLWRALAVFPETFDVKAVAAVWELEPEAAQDKLSELVSYSLLEWNGATRRHRLHDLAQVYADSRLTETERRATQQRHAAHYWAVMGTADQLYFKGGEDLMRRLELFDLEWGNVQSGQAWAAVHTEEDEAAARLCSDYSGAANLLALRQHPRQRIEWLQASLAAARRLKDREAEGVHLGNLGLAYIDLEETRRAIEFYEQTLEYHRKSGDRRGEGTDLNNLGEAYRRLGETRRAIEFYEKALAIDREIGERRGEGYALGNLGLAYARLGEMRRAIELYEQRLVISREIGDRRGEDNALGNLGNAYLDLEETQRAIEYYEKHLVIAREISDRRGEGNALGSLGRAYHRLEQPSRAIELYEQCLVIHRETGARRGEGNDLWNMALALEKLDNRVQAVASAEAALEIYDGIEDPNVDTVRERLAEWRGEGK